MPALRNFEKAQAETLHPSFQVDYDSDIWTFAQTTVAQQKEFVTVDWAIPLARGELLTDHKHRALLAELKCYLKTAIIEDTVRMTVGSIPATYMGLRELVKFMGQRKIHSLFDISTAVSWEYIEGLEEQ